MARSCMCFPKRGGPSGRRGVAGWSLYPRSRVRDRHGKTAERPRDGQLQGNKKRAGTLKIGGGGVNGSPAVEWGGQGRRFFDRRFRDVCMKGLFCVQALPLRALITQ